MGLITWPTRPAGFMSDDIRLSQLNSAVRHCYYPCTCNVTFNPLIQAPTGN